MLAIALVAAAIQMTTPDYAGMRPGRIDAGYLCFKGKKAGASQETMGFNLGTCDCPALGEDILCVKRLNCFPAGSHRWRWFVCSNVYGIIFVIPYAQSKSRGLRIFKSDCGTLDPPEHSQKVFDCQRETIPSPRLREFAISLGNADVSAGFAHHLRQSEIELVDRTVNTFRLMVCFQPTGNASIERRY